MKRFELLPHTADVRILATGDTHQNLFKAALEGLCSVLMPEWAKHQSTNLSCNIELSSVDSTTLLIEFLAEALCIMSEQKAILCSAEFQELSEKILIASVTGFTVDGYYMDVKAVTYHEADIRQTDDGYFETMIVLDI